MCNFVSGNKSQLALFLKTKLHMQKCNLPRYRGPKSHNLLLPNGTLSVRPCLRYRCGSSRADFGHSLACEEVAYDGAKEQGQLNGGADGERATKNDAHRDKVKFTAGLTQNSQVDPAL
jgi:hypothetical protein